MLYLPLAAVEQPTPSEIGSTLLSIAFILLILERAGAVVRFFWPNQQRGEKNIGNYATKDDIGRLELQIAGLTSDYKDLLKTSFDRYDSFNKIIADVRVGQEVLRHEISSEVNRLVDVLIKKIDVAEKHAVNSHKQSGE